MYYHCSSKNSHTLLDDCSIVVGFNERYLWGYCIILHT
nr:MAG TPA: hypothetical protein [Crassvirales sp.]